MTSPQPGKEYAGYQSVLADQVNRSHFDWTFKSDETYRAILEHVSYEQGEAYLELIKNEFNDRWEDQRLVPGALRYEALRAARINDAYGVPVTSSFPSLHGSYSPTNFRYIYHSLLALKHFSIYAPGAHVIELGAGYGGFAYIFQAIAPSMDFEVLSYRTIDLPEACKLQRKYADSVKFNLDDAIDGTNLKSMRSLIDATSDGPRFLFSAYAFSEFSPPIRGWYNQLLLNHCDHAFIVWNLCEVYRFTNREFAVENERPLTGFGNKYVSF